MIIVIRVARAVEERDGEEVLDNLVLFAPWTDYYRYNLGGRTNEKAYTLLRAPFFEEPACPPERKGGGDYDERRDRETMYACIFLSLSL